jgi:DNA/RNA endonuclease G (NUC1)
MPNEIISRNFEDYQCNTDDIETLTGMNFFSFLNDELEETLESYKPPLK